MNKIIDLLLRQIKLPLIVNDIDLSLPPATSSSPSQILEVFLKLTQAPLGALHSPFGGVCKKPIEKNRKVSDQTCFPPVSLKKNTSPFIS